MTDKFVVAGGPEVPEVEALDSDGESVKTDNPKCVAKMIRERHYLRIQTSGGTRLFNPLTDNVRDLEMENRLTGRPKWEFVMVTEDAYRNYVRFLKNKQPAYLKAAEREVR